MNLKKWHFGDADLGLSTRQGLEELCRSLRVLSRAKAMSFFDEAEKVTQDSREPFETELGTLGHSLFGNLMSTLAASDRQDFDATLELDPGLLTEGILMLETYDPVIPTLQCVARVDEDSFLTRTFGFGDVGPVKGLVDRPILVQK